MIDDEREIKKEKEDDGAQRKRKAVGQALHIFIFSYAGVGIQDDSGGDGRLLSLICNSSSFSLPNSWQQLYTQTCYVSASTFHSTLYT